MGPYTQIFYQILFSTKKRDKVLIKQEPRTFVQWGILNNNNCLRYRINGIEEHLHSVTQLQHSVARAALVKNIKLGSDTLMKHEGLFPNFNGGQHGYGAFTYAIKEKARLSINIQPLPGLW